MIMRRGFINHQNRFIHWRAVGEGPVVVLLHESPRSSTSLIPLMTDLSQEHCCIAIDTPGYGFCDPLPGRFLPISDFADTMLEAVTSLGVDTFHLYGTHTGAALAIELALLAPNRVTSLLLDGLAIFSNEEQQRLLSRYLIPQPAEWDGSHLMRIWSRIRDQALFFPFYDRSSTSLLVPPNQNLQFMLRTCLGFLEARDHYRDGYQAAIAFDARQKLAALSIPARLHVMEHDLLTPHISRAEGVSFTLEIEARPLRPDAWLTKTKEWFAQKNSVFKASSSLPQSAKRHFIDTADGPVFLTAGSGEGMLVRATLPSIRPAGMYGPPTDSDSAMWFVDAPKFGTNANIDFDIELLGQTLLCGIKFEHQAAPSFQCGEVSFDGSFLIKSWFAVRDSLFFEPWCDYNNPVFSSAKDDIDALSAGHLTLLQAALSPLLHQENDRHRIVD